MKGMSPKSGLTTSSGVGSATGKTFGFSEIYSAFPATGGIGTSEIAGAAYVSRAIG